MNTNMDKHASVPSEQTLNTYAPAELLMGRLRRLEAELTRQAPDVPLALIVDNLNQYWLTGTMQDGVLVIRPGREPIFFVRKSSERARRESPLDIIEPMSSYRDIAAALPDLPAHAPVWIEHEVMPLAMLERLRRALPLGKTRAMEPVIRPLRAVKDDFEQAIMRESGRQHARLLRDVVPGLLREGISEAVFIADLLREMFRLGYHGVSRFQSFQTHMPIGQIAFGSNSLYGTRFNGPGSHQGMHPAVPMFGSPDRLLRRGDLVFVDIGYGVAGYHTDKTQVYSFGQPPASDVVEMHEACRAVHDHLATLLRPGAIPADLYRQTLANLPPLLGQHFMGFGEETVRFLGHGVGLVIDEWPAIAGSIEEPLAAGMVIALEPKRGVPGVGLVGVEESFLIRDPGQGHEAQQERGPECLTGGASSIVQV